MTTPTAGHLCKESLLISICCPWGSGVIPSLGGYGSDTGGIEIADSGTDVSATAADYESVITIYHVTRLDMDVESSSLTDAAGIARLRPRSARPVPPRTAKRSPCAVA